MTKTNIDHLKELVDNLYLSHHPERDSWADYLFERHIYLVADETQKLCDCFGGNMELTMAGALLHDIGDATMSRFAPEHESGTSSIALDFLNRSGFSQNDTAIILGDILEYHSCRHGLPQTHEGKIMATADAIVHLTSDFYEHALAVKLQEGQTLEEIRRWALPKIDRDFYTKIFFDEVREEVRLDYEKVKTLFIN